eukprot:15472735-Alexandrium_andersonii.AAC.1
MQLQPRSGAFGLWLKAPIGRQRLHTTANHCMHLQYAAREFTGVAHAPAVRSRSGVHRVVIFIGRFVNHLPEAALHISRRTSSAARTGGP